MGHKYVYFIVNVRFRMIICQLKEANTFYFTSSILEKVNVLWKVFDTFCIP